jgi:Glycosyl hydrolase family 26
MTTPRAGSAQGGRRGLWRAARLAAVLALAIALAAGCGSPGPTAGGTPSATAGKTGQPCTVSPILAPACGAWWGMYLPTDTGGEGLDAAVAAQERSLGRGLDIIERYHDMSHGPNGVFPNPAETRLARQHLLLFSWAPATWSDHTVYRWETIASGQLDRSVIVPQAQRLRAFGHTVFLSFSAEPDGAVPGNGTPTQFIAAWRHIHDVFARQGVRNVVWVWITTGYVPHADTIAALYPGDRYVDWIGYDPYNFFNCHHSPWQSFGQTVQPFYQWLTGRHLGAGKPVMLAEFGSAGNPENPEMEAEWYRGVVPVLRGMPRLKALIMWNSSTAGCDLQLSADSAAARAYRQAGLSPYLRQALP